MSGILRLWEESEVFQISLKKISLKKNSLKKISNPHVTSTLTENFKITPCHPTHTRLHPRDFQSLPQGSRELRCDGIKPANWKMEKLIIAWRNRLNSSKIIPWCMIFYQTVIQSRCDGFEDSMEVSWLCIFLRRNSRWNFFITWGEKSFEFTWTCSARMKGEQNLSFLLLLVLSPDDGTQHCVHLGRCARKVYSILSSFLLYLGYNFRASPSIYQRLTIATISASLRV